MKATFHHRENLTDAISTFWFELERPWHYTAGQFTELTLPHPHPDNRGTKRWFTISSSPTNELASITTRINGPDQKSTFKKTLSVLEPGVPVSLEAPMGDFVLPKLLQTPILFVAAGIGITPFHSMLEWLAETGEARNIHLFYGVRSEDDIIFQDTLQKAGVHATIVVDDPSSSWGGARGAINVQMILGIDKPDEETLFYLSGPEPMLAAIKKDLLQHGVSQHQVVTDFFPGYTQL